MDIKQFVYDRAVEAKKGARELGRASSQDKNKALLKMAALIRERADLLKVENDKDIVAAKEKGLAPAMVDRLLLNDQRIEEMAAGLEQVATLPDPVGEITGMSERPNKL